MSREDFDPPRDDDREPREQTGRDERPPRESAPDRPPRRSFDPSGPPRERDRYPRENYGSSNRPPYDRDRDRDRPPYDRDRDRDRPPRREFDRPGGPPRDRDRNAPYGGPPRERDRNPRDNAAPGKPAEKPFLMRRDYSGAPDEEIFTAGGRLAVIVGTEPQTRQEILRRLWDHYREEGSVISAGKRPRAAAGSAKPRPRPTSRKPVGKHPAAEKRRVLESVVRRKFKETRELEEKEKAKE